MTLMFGGSLSTLSRVAVACALGHFGELGKHVPLLLASGFCALDMDRGSAARVQTTVERFLNASPLTRCRRFLLKVPVKSEESAALVKHQVSHVVNCVKARSFWCRTMLAHKIEVVRRKSHNLAQAVTSAIQVAWNDAAR